MDTFNNKNDLKKVSHNFDVLLGVFFLQIMLVNDINKDTVVSYLKLTTIIYIYNCIVFY